MAADLTEYAVNKSLELFCGKSAFSLPTTYIGLFLTLPDTSGAGGVEVSLGNYARIVTAGADWNAAAAKAIDNANDLTFAECSGAAWGLVVGIGLFDAISGGNLIIRAALAGSKQVDVGDTFRLEAGEIDLSGD